MVNDLGGCRYNRVAVAEPPAGGPGRRPRCDIPEADTLCPMPRDRQAVTTAAKPALGDRLRNAFLKPLPPGSESSAKESSKSRSPAELEEVLRVADDKERVIGLIAAPFAAAIGILVIGALISNDPAALLPSGAVNKLHVPPSTYHELLVVLLALSVMMLATAFFRKRLFLGITTALYGLALFNMHYWGFGIPFLLCGSWLLVRSYRAQKDLKLATAAGQGLRTSTSRAGGSGAGRNRPNKRYTPPSPRAKRATSR
jgi:hypothetical protein